MEQVHLKYGTSAVDFEIDGAKSVKYLYENKMRVIEDIKAEFLHCVTDGVIGTKPLKELIAPTDPVTIVISDMTRFWMRQDVISELLVKYLHDEMGVGYDQIAVVVALGTHRKNTAEDRRKLASEFVYDHVASVTDHDCDAPDLVYIGTTSFGTRVSVNPLAVGRKVICIGGTVHHLMAGYGGGRKSIVPGIASRETIRMNHGSGETDDGCARRQRSGGEQPDQPGYARGRCHGTCYVRYQYRGRYIFPPQRFILW